jgi:hypothetical protein
MKILYIGVLLLVSCCIISDALAKTEIVNLTPYEIKAIIEWAGGRGGWDAIPAGAVRRDDDGAYHTDGCEAIQGIPGWNKKRMDQIEVRDTSKDWSDLKKYYKIWYKDPDTGKWTDAIDSADITTGGLIKPVRVLVGNPFTDDDTNEPIFTISVESGR